jgi:hypothetical protein
MEKIMTRSARIGLAAALLLGGAAVAMAQNGPAAGGYPPARWNPNLYVYHGYYSHHNYYARPYAYVLHYLVPLYGYMGGVGSYWDYYRTDWPGRGNDEESTR